MTSRGDQLDDYRAKELESAHSLLTKGCDNDNRMPCAILGLLHRDARGADAEKIYPLSTSILKCRG